jgi:DNA invertase Pin-like site-specific DNA recombinase
MRTRDAAEKNPVVGYVRVSTSEQSDSGLGMLAQHRAIEAECERRGWSLHAVYEDAGSSGKSLKGRIGLRDALAAVEGGVADTMVVAKLDRLSRSLIDFAGLMERARARGWNLVALDLGVDLTTPAGEFLASVMASAAQWERRLIGQRTKDALAVLKNDGVRLGRPVTLPSEVRTRIGDERFEGRSLREIAEGLDADCVPTARGGRWQPGTVAAVLQSLALDNGARQTAA